MWHKRALPIALLVVPAWASAADETAIVLPDDPARVRVQAACSMCHSLDYIEMNSPFLDRAGWEKTVIKMINVMGAPIPADQAAEIVAYLDKYYGKQSPPSP